MRSGQHARAAAALVRRWPSRVRGRLYRIPRTPRRAQVRTERALLRELGARHYDLLVHLTEHPRGATLARLLRPRYAVARERSDAGRWWRRSFTHLYRTPRGTVRHTVELNLDALRRI